MAKKIKVKIAVAVDKDGNYVAYGRQGCTDWTQCMEYMLDDFADGEARYWVTADLELPEDVIPTVEGDVIRVTEVNHGS